MKQYKFWMVYNPMQFKVPAVRHDTYEEARNEALRMAEKEHTTCFVLESITAIEYQVKMKVIGMKYEKKAGKLNATK